MSPYETIKTGSAASAKKALSQLQQKPIVNQNYAYVKTSIKEPFGLLYFTPSLTCLGNLDDQSQNINTQLSYTPGSNWKIQLGLQKFTWDAKTQFGENLTKDKLEMLMSYAF